MAERWRIAFCFLLYYYCNRVTQGADDGFQCTFDNNDLCGMTQSTDDDYDWTIRSGPTPSSGTGPEKAHSGMYYIYAESSKPRKPGHKARIAIPAVTNSGKYCLSFQYNMFGFNHHISSLAVYLNGNKEILSKDKETDKEWYLAEVEVDLSPGDIISFEATRSVGHLGDTSLDDISLVLCAEPEMNDANPEMNDANPEMNEPNPPINTKVMQQPSSDVKSKGSNNYNFDCTFENDNWCGIYQNDDNFDWTMKSAPASPPHGKAHGGKSYISLEDTFKIKPGYYSLISLPRVSVEDKYCLKFYYYMSGAPGKQSELRVFKDRLDPDYTPGVELWSKADKQPTGGKWVLAELEVQLKPQSRVGFEGVLGSGGDGDLALDDISFKPC